MLRLFLWTKYQKIILEHNHYFQKAKASQNIVSLCFLRRNRDLIAATHQLRRHPYPGPVSLRIAKNVITSHFLNAIRPRGFKSPIIINVIKNSLLSEFFILAEKGGFEPPERNNPFACFRGRYHRPLGHLSIY